MKIHPVADIFPPMGKAEFSALKDDIEKHGQREAIWTFNCQIVDGRHRFQACSELDIEPRFIEWEGDEGDLVAFVVSLNLHRRHLNESQRAMVAGNIANMKQGARTDLASIAALSQTDAADLLNVSRESVQRARKVIDHGAPELVEKVTKGEVAVSTAAKVAELPKPKQAEIVAKGEAEILRAAKEIRAEKAQANREARIELQKQTLAIAPPSGRYRTIVIDPPWDMQKIERDLRPDQVGFDYPTMSEEELADFELPADDNCHLFCWTTQKHLPAALRLLSSWGFRYVFTMVWHKPGGFQPFGLPQYNCEFVVYGRKGSIDFLDTKAFPVCFQAPRREHSRKPDEFYATIERVAPGPRIDIFSRENREGFDQFGNETEKFNELQPRQTVVG